MKLNFSKRIYIGSLICFLCSISIAAQDGTTISSDKKAMILRMGEFKWVDPSKPAEEKMLGFINIIKEKVAETVAASGRFEVLNDKVTDNVNTYFQSEIFMNLPPEQYRKEIINAMNDYLLVGEITKCKFSKRTTGANGYLCTLALKLSVANAYEKANIISSRIFVSSLSGKKLIVRNTTEEALGDALQSMTKKLIDYFSKNFSVYGTIVSYDGNKAVVSCGRPQGVEEGDEFQVLQVTLIDGGKTQTEHVGKLKVKELLPDGTSICSMTQNKDDIIQRFQTSSNKNWLQCRLILNK